VLILVQLLVLVIAIAARTLDIVNNSPRAGTEAVPPNRELLSIMSGRRSA
jgi:hypothetical protein